MRPNFLKTGLNTDYEIPGIACDIPDIVGRCPAQTTGAAVPYRCFKIPSAPPTERGNPPLTSFFLDVYRTRSSANLCHGPGSAGTSIPHAQHGKR